MDTGFTSPQPEVAKPTVTREGQRNPAEIWPAWLVNSAMGRRLTVRSLPEENDSCTRAFGARGARASAIAMSVRGWA